jgi:hypothetical protein
MPLTQTQRQEIRWHLEYGSVQLSVAVPGGGLLGANAGLWNFDSWNEIETRMNSLTPPVVSMITGYPIGSFIVQGEPNPGDTLAIQFSGGNLQAPITITQTAIAGQNRTMFALALSAAVSQNITLANAGIQPFFAYSQQDLFGGNTLENAENILTEVQFVSPVAFNLSIVSASGDVGASITANGAVLPNPQTTLNTVSYAGFLPILNALYGLIYTSSDRLAVDKADVFTARKTEVKERRQLYGMCLDDLANLLMVPRNPQAPAGRRSNTCSL